MSQSRPLSPLVSPLPGKSEFFSLTEEQTKEFRETFDLFDENRDGIVTVPQLVSIFANMGQEPTDSELKDLLKKISKDFETGTLDFGDFCNLMTIRMTSEDTPSQIRRAFLEFDKNRDGFITVEELKAVLKSIGESLNDDEVLAMVNFGSLTNDGQIDMDAFLKIITTK
jgi:Ca2+-binding EF-hand superfamily protein